MAICDAVRSYRDELVERRERDKSAWGEARAFSEAALSPQGA